MTPLEFREDLDIHKTRKNGLSCGEESRFDRIPACDRRTDGRTDVQPIAKTCLADARKKYILTMADVELCGMEPLFFEHILKRVRVTPNN